MVDTYRIDYNVISYNKTVLLQECFRCTCLQKIIYVYDPMNREKRGMDVLSRINTETIQLF